MSVDMETRVQQYVALRDKIRQLDDEHKKVMAPYRETLAQLNDALLAHLNAIGGDSVRTKAGTVYKTTKKSASLADKSAFWNYVSGAGDWDLLDWKANVTAVSDYVEKHNTLPPGVSLTARHEVGVRRS